MKVRENKYLSLMRLYIYDCRQACFTNSAFEMLQCQTVKARKLTTLQDVHQTHSL